MRKRLVLIVSIMLAFVLGVGPHLALVTAIRSNVIADPTVNAAKAVGPKFGTTKPSRSPFSSKLLSKRPAQATKVQDGLPGQTHTLLPDSRELKIGGLQQDGPVPDANIGSNPIKLQRSRAWHTATMLPDGTVLIVGGIGANGGVVEQAEILNPETQTSELVVPVLAQSPLLNSRSSSVLSPRVYHTATLLTEGLVLIAGGLSADGKPLRTAELWDFRTREAVRVPSKLGAARYNHASALLPDGNVLLSGGSGTKDISLDSDELFNVSNRRFKNITNQDASEARRDSQISSNGLSLAGSLPEDGGTEVSTNAILAFRFNGSLQVESVNLQTFILTGPGGTIESRLVPAEEGMLVFVTPKTGLLPNSSYSLTLNGAHDRQGSVLNQTTIRFSTSRLVSAPLNLSDPDEGWIPDENNLRGNWRINRADSEWRSLRPMQAPSGVTAVAGQSLMLNGKPLAEVTLTIANQTTKTDQTGRFLLPDIPAGHQVMIIDGRSANRGAKSFGVFKVGVDIKQAETNVLPFTIWMTKLDTARSVRIPSPTRTDMVITNPRIPGLELRLPAQTVIRDIDGNNVTEISMTAVPVDRPPFPLPPGVNVPVFFTIQPGGSVLIPPRAQVIYPNFTGEPAGMRINFWNYDPTDKGWYIYGQGTVTENGKQIVPDSGVVIYEFSGIMIGSATRAPGTNCDCGSTDGDPVDLGTGLFVLNATDLLLPDVLPVGVTRTYRPNDSGSYSFGIGAVSQYEVFLYDALPSGQHWMQVYLVLPDGGRFRYDRISPGVSWTDAVLEHTGSPSKFYKSRISWNGTGWDLRLKDGTVLVFADAFSSNNIRRQSFTEVRDRNGNTLKVFRDSNDNLTRVITPNGHWIEFTSDSSNRVTQAKDNIGRTVVYTYDTGGRLWKVTDPIGGVTEYTYDSAARMLTIKDARGIVYLTNQYDSNGRVIQQTQADSTTYQFSYTLDGNGKVTQTDVTNPRGNHRIVTFNSDGYRATDTKGCSCGSGVTFERQTGTNLITAMTDALNRRTEYAYDSTGNATGVTRMAGTSEAVSTSFTYETGFNQIASVTDPLNHTTSFAYDSKGDLISATDALGHLTTFVYNNAGQPISATDPLGNSNLFSYSDGDLISVTNPVGHLTSRFLDAAGRVLSLTNPLGETIRYENDALNRITRTIDTLQGATQYSYDANGNVLSMTDGLNNVTSYVYDDMDRVQTKTDPLNHIDIYQYNQNGSLTQHTDRKGQVTSYTYDSFERLSQITYADSSSISYTYDAVGRLTQIVDSISGTISYSYDNLDRLLGETTPQGTTSYTYDAFGRRATMTVPGQSVVSYSYDSANRMTEITQGASTVSFVFDNANRRTSMTLPNGIINEYTYDAVSRVVALIYKRGQSVLGNLTYEYDAADRTLKFGGSFSRTELPPAVTSTSYDAANHQIGFGGQTSDFDLNGNLIHDGLNTFIWNARDQLVAINGSGLSASFQYDARRRRVTKTINGTSTSFVYDGLDVVQERVGSSASVDMLLGGIDEVLVRSASNGSLFPLADGMGSTIALTDSAGALQTEYSYEPFGRTLSNGAPSTNSMKYAGREEEVTALYYLRARYYSTKLQRFISEDPIGFAGGDPNLYAYVGNGPINEIDPLGLATQAHFNRAGIIRPGPPPTGGRQCKGLGAVTGTVMMASCVDVTGAGRLTALGLLGLIAVYTAMNPPKAIPFPDTICRDEPAPRDREMECIDAFEGCLDWVNGARNIVERRRRMKLCRGAVENCLRDLPTKFPHPNGPWVR